MSVKVMGAVWDLEIGPKEKFVLLAYADHANHEGESIYPAIASIARKTSYSERSVQRITRELENKGLLKDAGLGPKGTKRWRIPISGGVILSPPTSAISSPRGCQNQYGGVTKPVRGGDIALSPEPSSETSLKQPSLKPSTQSFSKSPDDSLGKYLDILSTHTEEEESLKAIQDEFENGMHLTPNWGKQEWNSLARWLLKRQDQGEPLSQFMSWYKSDDFRNKSIIYITPPRIKTWWPQAFTTQPVREPKAFDAIREWERMKQNVK